MRITAAIAPVHKLESKQERFDFYESLPKWFANGVYKQDDGVVLFRGGATDVRQFRAPAPGRYKFRIAVSAHQSPTPLPLGLLLGNFVVSGNYARHIGYFDAPPCPQPTVIEFEESLSAKNDTVKLMPMALPFVYLNRRRWRVSGAGVECIVETEGRSRRGPRRATVTCSATRPGQLAGAEDSFARCSRVPPPRGGRGKPFVAVAAKSLEMGQPFERRCAGYKAVLARVSTSASPARWTTRVASRLSYFWSTFPTRRWLAAKGELRKPEAARPWSDAEACRRKRRRTSPASGSTCATSRRYPDRPYLVGELLQWSAVRETHLFFESC